MEEERQLLVNHIFYQFGEINGYLARFPTPGDNRLADILRNISTGSGGELSLTNRLNRDTGYLRDDLDGPEEFEKSQSIQGFVDGINSRCPVYPQLPRNKYLEVYRGIVLGPTTFETLTSLLSNPRRIDANRKILPHPLPFSVSWTSSLTLGGDWSDSNLILKIQLPLSYPYLALSCPPEVEMCDIEERLVTKWLRQFYRFLPQVLNQRQLELLMMPSFFHMTGQFETGLRNGQPFIILTVRPSLMSEADQRRFLRAEIGEEISFP